MSSSGVKKSYQGQVLEKWSHLNRPHKTNNHLTLSYYVHKSLKPDRYFISTWVS